jgi:hypothetical protein
MAAPKKRLGCGVFLVLVGTTLMAQRLGWIPFDVEWFLPAALIAWGLAEVADALRS